MAPAQTQCPSCPGVPLERTPGGLLLCPRCQKRFAVPVDGDSSDQSTPTADETQDSPAFTPQSGTIDAASPVQTLDSGPSGSLGAATGPLISGSVSAGGSLDPDAPAVGGRVSTGSGGSGGSGDSDGMPTGDLAKLPFGPQFLTQYEPVSFLGKGAMGAVFLMKQVKLGRLVAVKCVNSESVSADVATRLEKEARTLASLNHPSILAIYDVGQDGEMPYMVNEFVEGEPLNVRMKHEPPLTPLQSIRIVTSVLDGLRAAHKQGIIHRDLKPSNIFLTTSGKPKIGDFGLAKSQNAPSGTAVGRILGTPGYMSPEQCRGRGVTIASDLYAVGIILFELLVGRRPFTGPGLLDYLRQHTMEQPPKLRSVRADFPKELEQCIAKALEKDPDKRWKSASEFRRALLDIAKAMAAKPELPQSVDRGHESSDLAPGVVLSHRYELVRVLGHGGMGQVWLAKDSVRKGAEVALKLLPPELWRDEEARANLQNEADIALKLTHPDIVRLINIEIGGSPFLVMELVLGPTMTDELNRRRQEFLGPLAPKESLAVLEPVSRALDYAHQQDVIHRDVKPSNFILKMDGTKIVGAKLADFGIAAELANFKSRVTGAVPTGTLSYMSPEQVACQKLDPRSDVYSLGASLFQMLTGHPPFVGNDVVQRIRTEPPPEVIGVPPAVSQVVRSALAKDPANRPQSAGELCRMLRQAIGDGTSTSDTVRVKAEQSWDSLANASVNDSIRPPASRIAAPPVDYPTDRPIQNAELPSTLGGPAITPLTNDVITPPPEPGRRGAAPLIAFGAVMLLGAAAAWPQLAALINPPPAPPPTRPPVPTTTPVATRPPIPQPPARGKLLIEGVEPNTSVDTPGGDTLGTAPGPFELDAGMHALVIRPGRDFEDISANIEIKPNAIRKWSVGQLQRKSVRAKVVTDPAGAEVLVNDVPRGKAPAEVSIRAGVETLVAAKLAGHVTAAERITVHGDDVRTVHLKLAVEEVSILVTSAPPGAAVLAATVPVGSTPFGTKAAPGVAVKYTLSLAGYRPGVVEGKTVAGKPLQLHANLEKLPEAPPTPTAGPQPVMAPPTPREEAEIKKLLSVTEKHLQEGEYDKALETALQALPIHAGYPKTHRLIAVCYVAKKQLQKAVKALERAIALNPKDTDTRNTLANILLELDQAAEALEIAKQNIAVEKNDATFWDTLGQAYLRLNNKKEAVVAFRRALKLDPEYKASIKGLKECGEKP